MSKKLCALALGCVMVLAAGCKKSGGGGNYPGTEEGAKALLSEFLKPGADRVSLSLALKPGSADYEAILAGDDLAKKAGEEYDKLWEMVKKQPIGPNEGQTEMKLWLAKTDDFKSGTGNAKQFPGGYGHIADKLKPGLTVVAWKFVKPGEDLGMAFDGLYFVNDHWVLMPKPWHIFR